VKRPGGEPKARLAEAAAAGREREGSLRRFRAEGSSALSPRRSTGRNPNSTWVDVGPSRAALSGGLGNRANRPAPVLDVRSARVAVSDRGSDHTRRRVSVTTALGGGVLNDQHRGLVCIVVPDANHAQRLTAQRDFVSRPPVRSA
jgi:hypothetical protein